MAWRSPATATAAARQGEARRWLYPCPCHTAAESPTSPTDESLAGSGNDPTALWQPLPPPPARRRFRGLPSGVEGRQRHVVDAANEALAGVALGWRSTSHEGLSADRGHMLTRCPGCSQLRDSRCSCYRVGSGGGAKDMQGIQPARGSQPDRWVGQPTYMWECLIKLRPTGMPMCGPSRWLPLQLLACSELLQNPERGSTGWAPRNRSSTQWGSLLRQRDPPRRADPRPRRGPRAGAYSWLGGKGLFWLLFDTSLRTSGFNVDAPAQVTGRRK